MDSIKNVFYYDLLVKGKVKELTKVVRQQSSWSSGEDIVLTSGKSMDNIIISSGKKVKLRK